MDDNANLEAARSIYQVLDRMIATVLKNCENYGKEDDFNPIIVGMLIVKDECLGEALHMTGDMTEQELVYFCLSRFEEKMKELNMPFEVKFKEMSQEEFEKMRGPLH